MLTEDEHNSANKNLHSTGLLIRGALLFIFAASADVVLTLIGTRGDLSLEGNPIIRFTMSYLGPAWGLIVQKFVIGGITIGIAYFGEPSIRRLDPWIWKVPATTWARNWLRKKDRFWIAFIPLYAAALAQALAAVSWVLLFIQSDY
jgi:hypothetical protein